jgi:hypothetical protein
MNFLALQPDKYKFIEEAHGLKSENDTVLRDEGTFYNLICALVSTGR